MMIILSKREHDDLIEKAKDGQALADRKIAEAKTELIKKLGTVLDLLRGHVSIGAYHHIAQEIEKALK